MKNTISIILCLCALIGCHSENPFISKDIVDAMMKQNEIKPVEYVSLILNNDVYWLRNFDRSPKKITSSSSQTKSTIRLSHDHTKIAYLNNVHSPVIIDTVGALKQQLTSYNNVEEMNWSADDKTLYMLINNQIKFYGPSLAIAAIVKEPEEKIVSVAITAQLDLLYIVRTLTGINQYTERLVKRAANGTTTTISKSFGETWHMKSIRLSRDEQYFTLGYDQSGEELNFVKFEVYALTGTNPVSSYEADEYLDPLYDYTSKFIVTAVKESSSIENTYYLAAIYTNNKVNGVDQNKYKFNFVGVAGSLYIDWK